MQITKEELAKYLQTWFNTVERNQNLFNRDPVAETLRRNLDKWGYWKPAKRGNPRKGYQEGILGGKKYREENEPPEDMGENW